MSFGKTWVLPSLAHLGACVNRPNNPADLLWPVRAKASKPFFMTASHRGAPPPRLQAHCWGWSCPTCCKLAECMWHTPRSTTLSLTRTVGLAGLKQGRKNNLLNIAERCPRPEKKSSLERSFCLAYCRTCRLRLTGLWWVFAPRAWGILSHDEEIRAWGMLSHGKGWAWVPELRVCFVSFL